MCKEMLQCNLKLEKLKCNSNAERVKGLLDIDISQPRYDQETYTGRAKHFFQVTNPINLLASSSALENARCIVFSHRAKQPLPDCFTEDDLWDAKNLYDSAYHPDSGELMPLIGRMSAQVPMNMIISGGMMTFYKSTPAVIFWQWINQSFNALVNHTNRSGDATLSNKQLLTSYCAATTGALVTALGLNRLVKNAPPLVGRLVPFVAVAAANCINIPLMRSQELKDGTPIFDANKKREGVSKAAAQSGISQVICSRIIMAAPGLVCVPFIMNYLERRGTLCRYPWANLPIQLALVGLVLTFATPLACAIFKQQAEIKFKQLEAPLRETLDKRYNCKPPQVYYYNKGL